MTHSCLHSVSAVPSAYLRTRRTPFLARTFADDVTETMEKLYAVIQGAESQTIVGPCPHRTFAVEPESLQSSGRSRRFLDVSNPASRAPRQSVT